MRRLGSARGDTIRKNRPTGHRISQKISTSDTCLSSLYRKRRRPNSPPKQLGVAWSPISQIITGRAKFGEIRFAQIPLFGDKAHLELVISRARPRGGNYRHRSRDTSLWARPVLTIAVNGKQANLPCVLKRLKRKNRKTGRALSAVKMGGGVG